MSFVTKEPHTQRVAAGGDVLHIGSKVTAQKSIPFRIVFILSSTKFDPAYRIGFSGKYGLGPRFFINKFRIPVLRDTLDSGMRRPSEDRERDRELGTPDETIKALRSLASMTRPPISSSV